MRHPVRVLIAAAVLVAGPVASPWLRPTALAQTPGTLTGESLIAGSHLPATTFRTTASCDHQGTSTITFTSSGIAVGAHSGTYTESGTVTLGPHSAGFPTAPVLSFQSTFTITAGATQVTGQKVMAVPSGTGSCITPEEHGAAAPQYFVEFRGFVVEFDATVSGPSGTWTEEGTASVSGIDQRSTTNAPQNLAGFGERFLTSIREDTQPAAVVLSPATSVNTVGETHTVTATVTTASGTPVQGAVVRFRVVGSVTTTGSCTTDAAGRCSFTYQGPVFPGADAITAYVDSDRDNTQDPLEPTGAATKTWVLPVSTPGLVTGGGQIAWLGDDVVFGFNAMNNNGNLQGECNVVDQATGLEIRCETVTTLVVTPTHAFFYGRARVGDDAVTTYRIDVDDLAESGAGFDTFKIQTEDGYVAGGVLTQGNIDIHDMLTG